MKKIIFYDDFEIETEDLVPNTIYFDCSPTGFSLIDGVKVTEMGLSEAVPINNSGINFLGYHLKVFYKVTIDKPIEECENIRHIIFIDCEIKPEVLFDKNYKTIFGTNSVEYLEYFETAYHIGSMPHHIYYKNHDNNLWVCDNG